MIFWQLFYTFCQIGAFTFGGGYAMISLIYSEVVERQGWLTAAEFTDIVAVSQATPGPVGINVATYSGYTAVVNAGFDPWLGVLGAVIASFAVLLIPVILMVLVLHFLQKYRHHPLVEKVFTTLRLTVVGLVAAAAILLITPITFGTETFQLTASILIFLIVFVAAFRYKQSPVLLLVLSALVGLALYA
jgi:chromate transporter